LLTVTYKPADVGDDTGCLEIASDDPDEPTVEFALTGTGAEPPPVVVDLDIAGLRVTKRVSLKRVKPVGITVVLKNNSGNSGSLDVAVVGMQNGIRVYNETEVRSKLVTSKRTTFSFPDFTPATVGDIRWTVTIADDDPDDDTAMATTRVVK
jgi:hypothetical protein